ncbi:MAG: hypothetical protein AB7K24_15800 [Gemmataceae bacterium]
MWQALTQSLSSNTIHHRFLRGDAALSYAEVLDLWQGDESFRGFFNTLLADAPFSAYRWETPAVTRATLDRPFEFVLLDDPGLDRPAERQAFAEHFAAEESVVAFANLGKDAHLVVPCPRGPDSAYGHLAAFVRQAPPAQRDLLWQKVGQTVRIQLATGSRWLSTAGMGVAWLHVRFDTRPKYYGHRPYQQPA